MSNDVQQIQQLYQEERTYTQLMTGINNALGGKLYAREVLNDPYLHWDKFNDDGQVEINVVKKAGHYKDNQLADILTVLEHPEYDDLNDEQLQAKLIAARPQQLKRLDDDNIEEVYMTGLSDYMLQSDNPGKALKRIDGFSTIEDLDDPKYHFIKKDVAQIDEAVQHMNIDNIDDRECKFPRDKFDDVCVDAYNRYHENHIPDPEEREFYDYITDQALQQRLITKLELSNQYTRKDHKYLKELRKVEDLQDDPDKMHKQMEQYMNRTPDERKKDLKSIKDYNRMVKEAEKEQERYDKAERLQQKDILKRNAYEKNNVDPHKSMFDRPDMPSNNAGFVEQLKYAMTNAFKEAVKSRKERDAQVQYYADMMRNDIAPTQVAAHKVGKVATKVVSKVKNAQAIADVEGKIFEKSQQDQQALNDAKIADTRLKLREAQQSLDDTDEVIANYNKDRYNRAAKVADYQKSFGSKSLSNKDIERIINPQPMQKPKPQVKKKRNVKKRHKQNDGPEL